MDLKDWEQRWVEGKIGFHEGHPNEFLVKFFPTLKLPPNSHCLMPLCGKSVDIPWIASQDQRVTGIEYSSIAIQSFFKEQGSGPYNILQGDFFELDPKSIPPVDWIYDRTALVAIPTHQQQKYADHLSSFIGVGKPIFLISFEYNPKETEGPPFPVSEETLQQLFSSRFEITPLARENILHREKRFQERGLTYLYEGAYVLKKFR